MVDLYLRDLTHVFLFRLAHTLGNALLELLDALVGLGFGGGTPTDAGLSTIRCFFKPNHHLRGTVCPRLISDERACFAFARCDEKDAGPVPPLR